MPITTSPSTLFDCPVSGCDQFPYTTQAEADACDHGGTTPVPGRFETVPNGFGGTTTRRVDESTADLATPAQVRYILKLQAERVALDHRNRAGDDPRTVAEVLDGVNVDRAEVAAAMTRRKASAYIDELLAFPFAAGTTSAPVAPTGRTNRYAAPCSKCGQMVAEGAGSLAKVDAKWTTTHIGECPTVYPAIVAPVDVPLPDVPAGHYAVENEDGELRFYEVDRPCDGRWAGRTFVSVLASDERHPIKNVETRRAILAKIALDPKAASLRYGTEIGRCGVCNRTLTDEASRAAGIGPVCAGRLGW